ncbi:hypothetical protein ES703_61210 [subsurface metagenome]
MLVEGEGSLGGVTYDQDQGVGHGPGGLYAGNFGAGDAGAAGAAADYGSVVHYPGYRGVDVANSETNDRDPVSSLYALFGRRGPAGTVGQHAQHSSLM